MASQAELSFLPVPPSMPQPSVTSGRPRRLAGRLISSPLPSKHDERVAMTMSDSLAMEPDLEMPPPLLPGCATLPSLLPVVTRATRLMDACGTNGAARPRPSRRSHSCLGRGSLWLPSTQARSCLEECRIADKTHGRRGFRCPSPDATGLIVDPEKEDMMLQEIPSSANLKGDFTLDSSSMQYRGRRAMRRRSGSERPLYLDARRRFATA